MTEHAHPVLTIGHSTHSFEVFLKLLRQHGVTAVADVRSTPVSRSSHFCKNALKRALRQNHIQYVFLGRELGARPADPAYYENGRVQYERLARSNAFRQGIDRVIRGLETHRVALMCAEKEPLECHRALLIARALDEMAVPVQHILSDGRLEAHADTILRLLDFVGLPHSDLFQSRRDLIDQALTLQEARIAYFDAKVAARAPTNCE